VLNSLLQVVLNSLLPWIQLTVSTLMKTQSSQNLGRAKGKEHKPALLKNVDQLRRLRPVSDQANELKASARAVLNNLLPSRKSDVLQRRTLQHVQLHLQSLNTVSQRAPAVLHSLRDSEDAGCEDAGCFN